MNKIIKTCKFVVDKSKSVSIDVNKLKKLSKHLSHKQEEHWINEAPIYLDELNTIDKLHLFLLFNSLSFSYWGDPKWTIEYKGKKQDGAFGLILSTARALENKIPILSPQYWASLTDEEFKSFTDGNTKIPLLKERLNILNEVGSVLIKNFNGDFSNLVKKAKGDAMKLINLIIENFPSFKDSSEYMGKTIFFNKRAQLLVSDISQEFVDSEFGIQKNKSK